MKWLCIKLCIILNNINCQHVMILRPHRWPSLVIYICNHVCGDLWVKYKNICRVVNKDLSFKTSLVKKTLIKLPRIKQTCNFPHSFGNAGTSVYRLTVIYHAQPPGGSVASKIRSYCLSLQPCTDLHMMADANQVARWHVSAPWSKMHRFQTGGSDCTQSLLSQSDVAMWRNYVNAFRRGFDMIGSYPLTSKTGRTTGLLYTVQLAASSNFTPWSGKGHAIYMCNRTA